MPTQNLWKNPIEFFLVENVENPINGAPICLVMYVLFTNHNSIFRKVHHATAKPSAVSIPFGCCNPRVYGHPQAACRQK
jgi:hypothetical protein